MYIAYSGNAAGNDLTVPSGMLKADGSDGVGLPVSTVERLIQGAINEINRANIDVRLTWGGRISLAEGDPDWTGNYFDYQHPNVTGIVIYSPLLVHHGGAIGMEFPDAESWYDPIGHLSYIELSPTATFSALPLAYSSGYDLQGIVLHEMLHSLGLFHSKDTTGSRPNTFCTDLNYAGSNPYWDGTVNPASVVNYSYMTVLPYRRLRRDDIEGLRHVWGGVDPQPEGWASLHATSGSWTSSMVPGAGNTPYSVTSSLDSHAVVHGYKGDQLVVWDASSGGYFNGYYVDSVQALTWQRPAIAQRGTDTLVAWIDERDKEEYLAPVKLARRTSAGGAWVISSAPGFYGFPLTVGNNQIGLGYDDVNDSYILTYLEGHDDVRAMAVVYDGNANFTANPVQISNLMLDALGNPVCESGACILANTRAHSSGGYLGFIVGEVGASSQFVVSSAEDTPYYSRHYVAMGVGEPGYFTVTLSQGASLVRKVARKTTMGSGLDAWRNFNTQGWPIALGSHLKDMDGAPPYLFLRYHTAYFPKEP